MSTESSLMWRGARPLVGTMIGVGILSLPFAVSQVGFVLGIGLLLAIGVVNVFILCLYADLVLVRAGKARFIHVIGRELGHFGTFVASTAYIGATYGALIAYLLFGGQFLRAIFYQWLPMSPWTASIWFFVIASVFTLGGSLFVARAQRILVPMFMTLLVVLTIIAIPHIDIQNYLTFTPQNIAVPLGVMLFAFQGMSALPEMRDILSRRPEWLSKSTVFAVSIVAVLYVIFITGVLGVTGAKTTENAIVGLGSSLGQSVVLLASGVAFLTTLTAYLNVTTALMNTYTYDLRLRFIPSWLLTSIIPLIFILLGVQSIVAVLGFSGGVLGPLTAIMMLIAYERARMGGDLPKYALRVPQWVVGLAFVIFASVMIGTIVG
ncbi:MAG: aromatic amino acid transport family protein [Patescibacteria group bacterium]